MSKLYAALAVALLAACNTSAPELETIEQAETFIESTGVVLRPETKTLITDQPGASRCFHYLTTTGTEVGILQFGTVADAERYAARTLTGILLERNGQIVFKLYRGNGSDAAREEVLYALQSHR